MAARRVLLAWLAFCLVTVQAVGFMHRVVHGASMSAGDHGGYEALFGHEEDGAECRVVDALGHAFVAPAISVVLPVLPVATLLTLLAGEFVARWSALFDARGPPPLD